MIHLTVYTHFKLTEKKKINETNYYENVNIA